MGACFYIRTRVKHQVNHLSKWQLNALLASITLKVWTSIWEGIYMYTISVCKYEWGFVFVCMCERVRACVRVLRNGNIWLFCHVCYNFIMFLFCNCLAMTMYLLRICLSYVNWWSIISGIYLINYNNMFI